MEVQALVTEYHRLFTGQAASGNASLHPSLAAFVPLSFREDDPATSERFRQVIQRFRERRTQLDEREHYVNLGRRLAEQKGSLAGVEYYAEAGLRLAEERFRLAAEYRHLVDQQ